MGSAGRYWDASRAPGTRAKYEAEWAAFGRWCRERGHPALPASPGAVAVYLSALADRHLAPSTIGRILAAIGHHHWLAGVVAPHKGEGGTVIADVLADVRDRALVSFGMASALRRSELVALTVAGLERTPDGLRVRVVRSKTDQEGRGTVIAVPDGRRLNPVAHLNAWLARAGTGEGPVFRSLVNGRVGSALTDQSVLLIVKRRAAADGASIWKMREVSRHKSVQVLSDYVQNSDLLKDHAGKDFL